MFSQGRFGSLVAVEVDVKDVVGEVNEVLDKAVVVDIADVEVRDKVVLAFEEVDNEAVVVRIVLDEVGTMEVIVEVTVELVTDIDVELLTIDVVDTMLAVEEVIVVDIDDDSEVDIPELEDPKPEVDEETGPVVVADV